MLVVSIASLSWSNERVAMRQEGIGSMQLTQLAGGNFLPFLTKIRPAYFEPP